MMITVGQCENFLDVRWRRSTPQSAPRPVSDGRTCDPAKAVEEPAQLGDEIPRVLICVVAVMAGGAGA